MNVPPGNCYVISIPRLAERQTRFRESWSFDFEFAEGVDYRDTDLVELAAEMKLHVVEDYKPFLAVGLAHWRLWRRLWDEGVEVATVFEDDCVPTGEPWVPGEGDLYRWFWPEEENFPTWIGTACYTVTRVALERILGNPVALAPDCFLYGMGFHELAKSRPVRVSALPSYPHREDSSPEDWLPKA